LNRQNAKNAKEKQGEKQRVEKTAPGLGFSLRHSWRRGAIRREAGLQGRVGVDSTLVQDVNPIPWL
jgi:hypothetical protein